MAFNSGGRGGRGRGGFRGRSSYGDRGGYGGGYGGGGSFGDRGGDDAPKPVKVGEEYDVEITEVGSKGDGICRIKNFVVFINGAKQGEKVKVKITGVMSRFATAEKVGEASGNLASDTAATETEPKSAGADEAGEVDVEAVETSEEGSESTEVVAENDGYATVDESNAEEEAGSDEEAE
jgi:predicted RNA-binding protein with TRAM domain